MRIGKVSIGFLTLMLICLICLVSFFEEPMEKDGMVPSFSVCVESDGQREVVHPWAAPDGNYWIFLPGYARLDQSYLLCGNDTVLIENVEQEDGVSLEKFECGNAYALFCRSAAGSVESTITFIRAGEMPSLHVDVSSGSMDYIHMEKGNEETGLLRLYDADGVSLYSGNLESVKGRGNTSWYAEKKPYNLTLTEEAGLLEMGASKRWVLLAEGGNCVNIRNKIVFDFAQRVNLPYTPQGEWVNLYLNGEYAGLYLLSERNEIHPNRIAIAEEGSFLISMENKGNMENQKLPYVELDSTQVLRIRDASMSSQELYQVWKTLKNALLSEDGCDPETGRHWTDLIDLDSWVRKFLVEEIFGNPDGGVVSQYFYLDGADPEKRIVAGPVWDYDYSMGGEDWWMRSYPSFTTMIREYTDDGMYLPWFYELYRKEEFYSRLIRIYEAEIQPQLLELTENGIPAYGTQIYDASVIDGIRWGHSETEVQQELAQINTFLENRERFLSDMWITGSRYHIVRVKPNGYSSGYFAVSDGDTLPQLPEDTSGRSLGWYRLDTDAPFDLSQPIYEDLQIYEKRQESSMPKIHFIPGLAVLLMLSVLAFQNMILTKKNGRRRNDSAEVNQISS